MWIALICALVAAPGWAQEDPSIRPAGRPVAEAAPVAEDGAGAEAPEADGVGPAVVGDGAVVQAEPPRGADIPAPAAEPAPEPWYESLARAGMALLFFLPAHWRQEALASLAVSGGLGGLHLLGVVTHARVGRGRAHVPAGRPGRAIAGFFGNEGGLGEGDGEEVAALRREVAELRQVLRDQARRQQTRDETILQRVGALGAADPGAIQRLADRLGAA